MSDTDYCFVLNFKRKIIRVINLPKTVTDQFILSDTSAVRGRASD